MSTPYGPLRPWGVVRVPSEHFPSLDVSERSPTSSVRSQVGWERNGFFLGSQRPDRDGRVPFTRERSKTVPNSKTYPCNKTFLHLFTFTYQIPLLGRKTVFKANTFLDFFWGPVLLSLHPIPFPHLYFYLGSTHSSTLPDPP